MPLAELVGNQQAGGEDFTLCGFENDLVHGLHLVDAAFWVWMCLIWVMRLPAVFTLN
jgi:hypothetical protein